MTASATPGGHRTRTAVGLALGTALVVVAVWLAGPARLTDALGDAQPLPLALAALALVALTLARGAFWAVLLVGRASREIVGTASAANAVGGLVGHLVPFRGGVVVRAGVVARRAGLPLPRVLSSLAVERGLDLAATATVAVAATVVFGWTAGRALAPFLALSVLVLAGLVGLVVAVLRWPVSRRPRWVRLVPERLREPVAGGVVSFREGLASLGHRGTLARAGAWLVVVVACQFAVLGGLVAAFLPSLPLPLLLAGLPWLALSLYLAVTPSHLGTFEGVFAAIYVPLGVGAQDALAAAVLVHAALIGLTILLGAVAWALLAFVRRAPEDTPVATPGPLR